MPRWPSKADITTAPAHAADLCTECGTMPLDRSTTVFTCEHGSWTFTPAEASDDAEAAPAEAK